MNNVHTFLIVHHVKSMPQTVPEVLNLNILCFLFAIVCFIFILFENNTCMKTVMIF